MIAVRPRSFRRARARLVSALIAASLTSSAAATEGTQQCLVAYEDGQRLRQAGDLVASADRLLSCGGPACPVRMQGDCQRWLDEVRRSIPTVVFRVRDAAGTLLTHARVSIDAGPWQRLEGRAILMNPGEHVAVFEHPEYRSLRTPVFVTEGEKLEPHDVVLQRLGDPAATPRSSAGAAAALQLDRGHVPPASVPRPGAARSSVAWPIAAGAIGALGGAGFAFFGLAAKRGERDLERCTPDCARAQVDGVKSDYLVSNVSLGVGVVGLATAALLLLLRADDSSDPLQGQSEQTLDLGTTPGYAVRF
jgi:hypothetical protein